MLSFSELNRRNVVRVGAAYLAVAWLVIQVAQTVLPLYGFGAGAVRAVITVLGIGLLPTLIFAWVFEITPDGIKLERDVVRDQSTTRVTGRKLDFIIIAVLTVALLFFVADRLVLEPSRNQEAIETAFQDGQTRALVDSFGDRSIAVLPFTNMSGDADQEFFSDGISEELLNLLAQVPQLRVISRSSAFAFKGQAIGVPEIARQLRVVHVLEGSVRKAGNKVRITAQLIDARTDAHVWSTTYDRTMDDIFAIQDEIAAQVVDRLKVSLLGPVPRTHPTDPQVYTLYLQAKRLNDQKSKESYEAAVALLQQAVTLDPLFIDGWTALAGVYFNQTTVGLRPFAEGFGLAEGAINRAKAIDATDPEVLCAMSDVKWLRDFDLPAAATLLRNGLATDPSNEYCLRRLALMRSAVGQHDAAIEVWTFLDNRDPINRPSVIGIAVEHWLAGHLDAALLELAEARELSNADVASMHALEALVRVSRAAPGDLKAALAAAEAESLEGWRLQAIAIAQYALGNTIASDQALKQLIDKYAQGWPFNIAAVYAYRGERDHAFEWLDRAIKDGDLGITTVSADPQFRILHSDPRWPPLLTKVGQSPEQLARVDLAVALPSDS